MLYRLFYYLFKLTVNGYFRSVYIKGKGNIPETGPVIFAPNHTSAFMDPILLATEINRSLYFLARGDVFRNSWIAKLLAVLHLIPIYKKDDAPDEVAQNADIFQRCFEHLANGGTLMIFPEGTSRTERRLRPIKTGTARIALGAEKIRAFKTGVKIVPIGINYSNPHSFRSDVFVNFGEPIDASVYREKYEINAWGAVEALTQDLKKAIEQRVIIIKDEKQDKLIKQIEILYRSKLRNENEQADKAPQDFYLSKEIVNAVDYHLKRDPKRLEVFQNKLAAYLKGIKKIGIRDTQIRTSRISFNLFWAGLFFSLGSPLFLFGLIANAIPYKLAGMLVKSVKIRADFIGSVRMAGGMFIFLFCYILQSCLFGFFTSFWWGLAFLLLSYPSGLFAITYLKQYYQIRGSLKYVRLFLKKSALVAHLWRFREELVAELEDGRKAYIKAKEALNLLDNEVKSQ